MPLLTLTQHQDVLCKTPVLQCDWISCVHAQPQTCGETRYTHDMHTFYTYNMHTVCCLAYSNTQPCMTAAECVDDEHGCWEWVSPHAPARAALSSLSLMLFTIAHKLPYSLRNASMILCFNILMIFFPFFRYSRLLQRVWREVWSARGPNGQGKSCSYYPLPK